MVRAQPLPQPRPDGGHLPGLTPEDLVRLIRDGVGPGLWADLGSGEGAFTLALAELLGPDAEIHSVDRDHAALSRQRQSFAEHFPAACVTYHEADFTQPLKLPPLDGVLMANSLHFQRRPLPVLEGILGHLRPGGRLLVVEYNADRGNPWVPHPISYAAWERLAAEAGLVGTRLLATYPSRWLRELYSALSLRPPPGGGAGSQPPGAGRGAGSGAW